MATSRDLVNRALLDMDESQVHDTIASSSSMEWLTQNLSHYDAMVENPPVGFSDEAKRALDGICVVLRFSIKGLKKKRQQRALPTSVDDRIARLDLGIKSETLSHSFDLNRFKNTVDSLFCWIDKPAEREIYLAPYVVVIQSSGMGKTKLLYEFSKANDEAMDVHLLLCTTTNETESAPTQRQSEIHTDLPIPQECSSDKSRETFTSRLDAIVDSSEHEKVVLLVDEAQHLVKVQGNSDEFSDGFYFRCFRHWLRFRRQKKVVAVFAGTTSKLSNFFVEKQSTNYSRNAPSFYYNERGTQLYSPFFELTTSGAGKNNVQRGQEILSDFRKSIRFGRPLFHVMNKTGVLDDDALTRIKRRLQISENPETDSASWLSVLSVRVQMGQTTSHLVSTLVALGYANLTHFQCSSTVNEGFAILQHCHFPDPVLARAAMEIMNKKREVWPDRARKLFSSGLCTPAKGDLGEVAAALFMLFCGDELRKDVDVKLERFAVPLGKWLGKMGAVQITGAREDCTAGKYVSFIQFCRNYVRLSPGEIAKCQDYLKELHESACGIYTYSGAEACDLVAAISCVPKGSSTKRLRTGNPDAITTPNSACAMDLDDSAQEEGICNEPTEGSFEALLVSVKNCLKFSHTEMGQALAAMIKQLREAGLVNGVCLLILVGRTIDEGLTDEEAKLVECEVKREFPQRALRSAPPEIEISGISCYVVIVNNNDEYGIGKMLQCATCPGGEHSEMYASHFSLASLVEQGNERCVLRSSLRCAKGKEDVDVNYVKELSGALRVRSDTL